MAKTNTVPNEELDINEYLTVLSGKLRVELKRFIFQRSLVFHQHIIKMISFDEYW